MKLARLRLIFHFSFVVLIPCLSANIAEVDEVCKPPSSTMIQTM